jgi:hypothetical protein
MSIAPTKVVLGCGNLIVTTGSRELGKRVHAAVVASAVPLHVLDRRFSTQAALVVAPDPSVVKGIARQAAVSGIPVLSEPQALDAIAVLNAPLVPGWCDCAEPVMPSRDGRSWEHHRFGVCGWPERRCSMPEHRRSWCRACLRVVRLCFCHCAGDWRFTYDRDREWWVHAVCGWPTQAWFSASGAHTPDLLDGTPSWLWRIHKARADVELKACPLPAPVSLTDRQWEGRYVED